MTCSEKFTKIRRASPFEEFAGSLKELFEQDGALIALIGEIYLALPSDLEQNLRQLIGRRITILRTDIPQKLYIFRILDQNPTSCEKASVSEGCLSI